VEPLHPTEPPEDLGTFEQFALADEVQEVIAGMGIKEPTPIQALAITPVLEGRDVIAKAETGTGKTLAFGAPMISKIDHQRVSVLGLVLCPTRELAEQVATVLAQLGKPREVSVALIVGGEPVGPQVEALQSGAQVVVGTPGRVLDLYQQRFLSFPWTEFAVLDEADEMLEIGFIDDVRKILSYMPDERQTLLFSATFPTELLRLAREYTSEPAEVATAKGVATVDNIEQEVMFVSENEKAMSLIRLIEQSDADDVLLVFCARRTDVEQLMRRLERISYPIKALHGGYDQQARFRVMSAFRDKEVKALIATDVASRGLDVVHVTHVVNFGVPRGVTEYTHRIGRTGRAGRDGRATTLVAPLDQRRWRGIVSAATWEIREVDPPERSGRGRSGEEGRRSRSPRRTDGARGRGGEAEGRDRGRSRERTREGGREGRGDSVRRREGGRPGGGKRRDRDGERDGRSARRRGAQGGRGDDRSPERADGKGRRRGGDGGGAQRPEPAAGGPRSGRPEQRPESGSDAPSGFGAGL
jgi:ATP-dependent RNA helicase DeaD